VATLGFDIEQFVCTIQPDDQDEDSGDYLDPLDHVVPVCGLVGGDKSEHTTIRRTGMADQKATWEVHEDNVCVEINSPVFTESEEAREWFQQYQTQFPYDLFDQKELWPLNTINSYAFKRKDLEAAGPQALDIGCDPDFDGYARDTTIPRRLNIGTLGNTRMAGGHIHIGYSTHEDIPHFAVAQLMDLVVLAAGSNFDRLRVGTYPPGIFRVKPYGIEYRSMGSKDLLRLSGLVRPMFNLARALEDTPQELVNVYDQFNFPKLYGGIMEGNSTIISGAKVQASKALDWLNPKKARQYGYR